MKRILGLLLASLLVTSGAQAQSTQTYPAFINGQTAVPPTGSEVMGAVSGSVTNQVTSMQIAELTSAVVTQAPYNASGFIVQTLTSGSVASGTTNIPVNSSAGFNTGQIVIVALAGTSATKNFAGTISAIPDGTHITVASTAVTANLLPSTATSSATGTQATTIPAGYTVYSLGTTTTGTTVSNGATALALTNAASYQKGQGILVYGCAASGANLITQITAVASNAVTISPAVSNAGGCTSSTAVQHDETSAFQAAVNLVSINRPVKIFVPDGFYQINGPAQNTGTANAIIQLPNIPYYNSGLTFWGAQTTLAITGNTPAPQMQSYFATSAVPHTAGAIIHTDATGGVKLFGGYYSGQYQNFTNVQLVMDNITLRNYPNPNVTMVDAGQIESFQTHGVDVDTGETGAVTQPTNTGQFAFIMPLQGNGGSNLIDTADIMGQYNGVKIGEHMRFEHVRFDSDFIPMQWGTFTGGYGTTGIDVECNSTPYCVYASTGVSHTISVEFQLLNIEHHSSPAWVSVVADIYDPSNFLGGKITFDTYGSGDAPVYNGGVFVNAVISPSDAYPFSTSTFAGLSGSHYSGARNGTTLYCSDCTKTTPCAGSGTGALAKMLNSAWDCN